MTHHTLAAPTSRELTRLRTKPPTRAALAAIGLICAVALGLALAVVIVMAAPSPLPGPAPGVVPSPTPAGY